MNIKSERDSKVNVNPKKDRYEGNGPSASVLVRLTAGGRNKKGSDLTPKCYVPVLFQADGL